MKHKRRGPRGLDGYKMMIGEPHIKLLEEMADDVTVLEPHGQVTGTTATDAID